MIMDEKFTPSNNLRDANTRIASLEHQWHMRTARYYRTEAELLKNKCNKNVDELLCENRAFFQTNIAALRKKYGAHEAIPATEMRDLALKYSKVCENLYYEVAGLNPEYGVVDYTTR